MSLSAYSRLYLIAYRYYYDLLRKRVTSAADLLDRKMLSKDDKRLHSLMNLVMQFRKVCQAHMLICALLVFFALNGVCLLACIRELAVREMDN